MKPRIGDRIPEFLSLEGLHTYMSAEYHGQSYSVDPPDKDGFRFVFTMDNSTGAKTGTFPAAFLRAERAPVRYLPVIESRRNVYTDIAELYYGIEILERVLGYYLADNESDIRGMGFSVVDSIKLGLEIEYSKRVKAVFTEED